MKNVSKLALKMDELIQNLNRLLSWFWNWFQLHQFWIKSKPLWHKSLHFLSQFNYSKVPSGFNIKCLRSIIKNGHFIGFKPLFYSILVIFFRLKNPKDTEVFLALKMGELIQNLNLFWGGSEISFSSINFELIGNLFDTKVSIFYLDLIAQKYLLLLMENVSKLALKTDELIQNLNCLLSWFWNWFQNHQFWVNRKPFWHKNLHFLSWFDCTKMPSSFNKKYLQISFKNRWINSEIGFSSINFELIGNLFDTKVSIFYLDLITQKHLLLLMKNVSKLALKWTN
jgi:hypothetical protein